MIPPERRTPDGRCLKPIWERMFNAIIGGLFVEGLVGPGSMLDAGAHTGAACCYYASIAPTRPMHAVEPIESNVDYIRKHYANLTNLVVLHGGLGARDEMIQLNAPKDLSHMQAGLQLDSKWFAANTNRALVPGGAADTVEPMPQHPSTAPTAMRVYTVDGLFGGQWRGEQLALATFDVEGLEADVVRGARATIERDLPIITVEVMIHEASRSHVVGLLRLSAPP